MQAETKSSRFFVGVDLGGTNIKAGVVDDTGRSLARVKIPTQADQGPEVGLNNIVRAVHKAVEKAGVEWDEILAVGLATPGTMDIPAGMLLNPPNLPGWDNVPIRQQVAHAIQKPTFLQNDANSAAFGESWVGAGRDAHSLVLWTLGTGIGGGIIIGDSIISGEHSHGSECGHVIIEMDNGRFCDTGQYGTLEAYAGGKSLVRRCQEALETTSSTTAIRGRVDQGDELTPLLIAECAEAGDDLANQLVMDTAKFMGVGTTTVMHTVDPDLVLIGGAMTFGRNETELGRRFIQRIRDEVKARAFPVPAAKTKIEFAELGGDAGYIGVAGYARLQIIRA